jgi:hypothetical protein
MEAITGALFLAPSPLRKRDHAVRCIHFDIHQAGLYISPFAFTSAVILSNRPPAGAVLVVVHPPNSKCESTARKNECRNGIHFVILLIHFRKRDRRTHNYWPKLPLKIPPGSLLQSNEFDSV